MASNSTSSSPLFEQPFAEMNFGRLRRRENDTFATPQHPRDTQPRFPTQSQQTQPQYYTHSARRRSNTTSSSGNASVDRWVPRLFKAILWSPLVVVVLWTGSAVLFTRRVAPLRGNTVASVQVRPASSKKQRKQQQYRHSSGGESIKESFMTGVEVLETALGKQQPQRTIPIVAPLGQYAPQGGNRLSRLVHGIGNMVQGKSRQQGVIVQPANLRPPLGQEYQGIYNPNEGGNYYSQQQQQQPVMQYEGVYMQEGQGNYYPQNQQQQQPAMQYEGIYKRDGQGNYYSQQGQQQPAMQYEGVYMQEGQGNYYSQNQQQQPAMQYEGIYMQDGQGNYYSQQGQQQQQPAMQYEGIYMQEGQGNYPQQQQPAMQATGKSNHLRGSTQYLYYDPKDVVVVNGQVYLPPQAYDKNGRPHDLTNTKAQVYIQPPPLFGVHHFNHSNVTDSNYTYFHPNTVKTPVFGHHSGDKEDDPAKGIAMPNMPAVEGNSSSILVATVGVVALLVGALSARHARGRACLNACLENETLASEVAYDTAHTRANTYSTFWKGDLEKFDV